jgi:hypothetical protein
MFEAVDEIKLKPCPECGSFPELICTEGLSGKDLYKYFCGKIGVHVSCGDWKTTAHEAAEDWNRRTTGDGQPEYYKPTRFEVFARNKQRLAEFLMHIGSGDSSFDNQYCHDQCGEDDDCPHELQCIIDWLDKSEEEKDVQMP